MALVLTRAPTVEPITVADAKAHLRIEVSSEDVVLASLVLTSRLHVETALGLALLSQGWTLTLDEWPAAGVLHLPIRPLLSVDAVRVLPSSGAPALLHPSTYIVDTTGWRARAVEFFERVATTQYLNHPRPHALRTPDLRQPRPLQRFGGQQRVGKTVEGGGRQRARG